MPRWLKYLLAIFAGNCLYFALLPHLPPRARHEGPRFDLGTVVDLWFCVASYGLLELGAGLLRRNKR